MIQVVTVFVCRTGCGTNPIFPLVTQIKRCHWKHFLSMIKDFTLLSLVVVQPAADLAVHISPPYHAKNHANTAPNRPATFYWKRPWPWPFFPAEIEAGKVRITPTVWAGTTGAYLWLFHGLSPTADITVPQWVHSGFLWNWSFQRLLSAIVLEIYCAPAGAHCRIISFSSNSERKCRFLSSRWIAEKKMIWQEILRQITLQAIKLIFLVRASLETQGNLL